MAFEIQLVKVSLMFTCDNSSQMKDMFIPFQKTGVYRKIVTVVDTSFKGWYLPISHFQHENLAFFKCINRTSPKEMICLRPIVCVSSLQ